MDKEKKEKKEKKDKEEKDKKEKKDKDEKKEKKEKKAGGRYYHSGAVVSNCHFVFEKRNVSFCRPAFASTCYVTVLISNMSQERKEGGGLDLWASTGDSAAANPYGGPKAGSHCI